MGGMYGSAEHELIQSWLYAFFDQEPDITSCFEASSHHPMVQPENGSLQDEFREMFSLNHHWRKVKGMLLKKNATAWKFNSKFAPENVWPIAPRKEISSSNHWISRGIHLQKFEDDNRQKKTSLTITTDVILLMDKILHHLGMVQTL